MACPGAEGWGGVGVGGRTRQGQERRCASRGQALCWAGWLPAPLSRQALVCKRCEHSAAAGRHECCLPPPENTTEGIQPCCPPPISPPTLMGSMDSAACFSQPFWGMVKGAARVEEVEGEGQGAAAVGGEETPGNQAGVRRGVKGHAALTAHSPKTMRRWMKARRVAWAVPPPTPPWAHQATAVGGSGAASRAGLPPSAAPAPRAPGIDPGCSGAHGATRCQRIHPGMLTDPWRQSPSSHGQLDARCRSPPPLPPCCLPPPQPQDQLAAGSRLSHAAPPHLPPAPGGKWNCHLPRRLAAHRW